MMVCFPEVLFLCALFFSTSWSAFIPEKVSNENQAAFRSRRELVDYINSLNTTWKASLTNRFHDEATGTVRPFRGGVMRQSKHAGVGGQLRWKSFVDASGDAEIPEKFDARIRWPYCPSISEVGDQSTCGSSWAVAAAQSISDRICIASNGTRTPRISAADLISCCSECSIDNGCKGGFSFEAWQYWMNEGLVTGGNFTTGSGCKPYPFPPCDHYVKGGHFQLCPQWKPPHAPMCVKKCQQNYTTPYEQDKHYGNDVYRVGPDLVSIQREIMNNGSVEANMNVYEDFEVYESGVYQHVSGYQQFGFTVRIIGWGKDDNGVPYWLVMNSWNEDWGEDGLFRIKRGSNECEIEDWVVAGIPK